MSARLPMLLYHSICERPDPRFAEWAVTPAMFGAQMDRLAAEGYRTITVRELAARAFGAGPPLGEREIAVTFDDGFADFHEAALEHLLRNGQTATVFVTTARIGATSSWLRRLGEGERPMMSDGQLAEIAAEGIELGAHGHTHAQLDTVSRAAVVEEIERSRDALERVAPVSSFAYPHGYSSRRVRRAVQRAGFGCACSVDDAIATTGDDRYALARLIVRGATGCDELIELLRGDTRRARRPLRRTAWRAVRRAGAEPLAERLLGVGATNSSEATS